jgi:hypothetical protein
MDNDQPPTVVPKAPLDFTSSVGASVLVGVAAALGIHGLQWLCGWGWGSLWNVLSTATLVSLGITPWMLAHEGHEIASAGFGATVGAALGVAYGWLTGGLLSGILFCTCVGTWSTWFAERRGLISRLAQSGVIVVTLTVGHLIGMLAPAKSDSARSTGSHSGSTPSPGAARTQADEIKKQWDLGAEIGAGYVRNGLPVNSRRIKAAEFYEDVLKLEDTLRLFRNRDDAPADIRHALDKMRARYDGFMSTCECE